MKKKTGKEKNDKFQLFQLFKKTEAIQRGKIKDKKIENWEKFGKNINPKGNVNSKANFIRSNDDMADEFMNNNFQGSNFSKENTIKSEIPTSEDEYYHKPITV